MMVLGDTARHLRLVLKMGRITRTDLLGAYRSGDLTQRDWAQAVQRCRGCGRAEMCRDWLSDAKIGARVPFACPNLGLFYRIRAETGREL